MNKIKTDLNNGNVQVKKCVIGPNGVAMMNAAGIGLNTNGIITSCIPFIKNADKVALQFGKSISYAGLVIGASQTYIGFTDGDISTGDIFSAVSTALNAAGVVCAFIPGGIVVSGVLGVTSCVVGLIGGVFSYNMPSEIHIQLDNGTNFYLYLV